jgi:aminopeptidase
MLRSKIEIAEKVLIKLMGADPRDRILVVTDAEKLGIGEIFFEAAVEIGADPIMTVIKVRENDGEEPPSSIAHLMKESDVVLIPTARSLTHTQARIVATRAGARIASMPKITLEMIGEGGLTADYQQVATVTRRWMDQLKKTKEVRIQTQKGTEISFSVEHRTPGGDLGLFDQPGSWGNLPAGEAYIAPVEGTAHGLVVVDGTFSVLGKLDEPIMLTIQGGKVVSIEGGKQAEQLSTYLKDLEDPVAYWVGEFGIGTNEKSKFIGVVLEDEKILGTVHFGFGTNVSMGGTLKSKVHLDGVITCPTVWFDGHKVIENGEGMPE